MDIYIKPVMKADLAQRNAVFIKDVAEVVAEKNIAAKVNCLKILNINEQKNTSFLVSVTDIIRVIQKEYPNATINNVGAEDTVIDYKAKKFKETPMNTAYKFLKIVFVGFILFAGAGTAIMSFYTDSQINKIFQQIYYMIYGSYNAKPLIIEVPYAFGLTFGIIVFFNHFAGKKISSDPTPIEVEMSVYESDTTDTMIDRLNRERKEAEM